MYTLIVRTRTIDGAKVGFGVSHGACPDRCCTVPLCMMTIMLLMMVFLLTMVIMVISTSNSSNRSRRSSSSSSSIIISWIGFCSRTVHLVIILVCSARISFPRVFEVIQVAFKLESSFSSLPTPSMSSSKERRVCVLHLVLTGLSCYLSVPPS